MGLKILERGSNYFFCYDESQHIYYCFSYDSLVATYTEEYGFVEFDGVNFNSRTTTKHKKRFKAYLHI